jgi:hypothetical protein
MRIDTVGTIDHRSRLRVHTAPITERSFRVMATTA